MDLIFCLTFMWFGLKYIIFLKGNEDEDYKGEIYLKIYASILRKPLTILLIWIWRP